MAAVLFSLNLLSNAISEATVNRCYLRSGYTFSVADKERNFPPFHNRKHHC